MTWVFNNSEATGSERLVLLALADHADDEDWSCWPSIERLAKKARVSESTARRCIKKLEQDGRLQVQTNAAPSHRQDRRTNMYTLVDEVSGCTPVENGVSNPALRGVKRPDNGVSTVTPKPSLEPSLNRNAKFEKSEPRGARQQPPREGCVSCDGGWIERPDKSMEYCYECRTLVA